MGRGFAACSTILLCALFGRTAPAQDAPPLRRKVLVVSGRMAEPLMGAPIPSLRLMARRGDDLVPVPYQIDERTPQGGYAHDSGITPVRDAEHGVFDRNDEMAFSTTAGGQRATPKMLESLGAQALEIEVEDNLGGQKVYVYLLRYEDAAQAPPPSEEDAVSIAFEEDGAVRWGAGDLVILSSPENPAHLRSFQVGERTLPFTVSFRLGARFHHSIRRDPDEFGGAVVAYTDGPVRVLAQLRLETYLIWGHWVRCSRALAVLEPGSIRLNLVVEVPVDLEAGEDSFLDLIVAQRRDAKGEWTLHSPLEPNGRSLDITDANRKPLTNLGEGPLWVGSRSVGLRTELRAGSGLDQERVRGFFDPQANPEARSRFGHRIDLTRAVRGPVRFSVRLFLTPGARELDIPTLLKDHSPPVTVLVRAPKSG